MFISAGCGREGLDGPAQRSVLTRALDSRRVAFSFLLFQHFSYLIGSVEAARREVKAIVDRFAQSAGCR